MIYENQLLQIGLKSEYRQNLGEQPLVKSRFKKHNLLLPNLVIFVFSVKLCYYCCLTLTVTLAGRMYVFYGNKTSTQFLSFSSSVSSSDALKSHILS